MRILKNIPEMVKEEEQLVTYIYDVSFPKWVYEEIPQLESEFQKEIWYIKLSIIINSVEEFELDLSILFMNKVIYKSLKMEMMQTH